ncbi:MAG: hypothetical protein NC395_05080 [Prevotella sp.]|nr:hypothetical protein [Prevotella sp.]
MKISKKAIVTLCIIVPILALVLFCILWFNQKPDFSKYNSYAVVTDNGDIPLTDGQFRQVVQAYKNDGTLQIRGVLERMLEESNKAGYKIKLYKTADMAGNYDTMYTGNSGIGDGSLTMCLWINDTCFMFENSKTGMNVLNTVKEAIAQSESEREL